MKNNENKNRPTEIADSYKYRIVPAFSKIPHNSEFTTRTNDIFGVMA